MPLEGIPPLDDKSWARLERVLERGPTKKQREIMREAKRAFAPYEWATARDEFLNMPASTLGSISDGHLAVLIRKIGPSRVARACTGQMQSLAGPDMVVFAGLHSMMEFIAATEEKKMDLVTYYYRIIGDLLALQAELLADGKDSAAWFCGALADNAYMYLAVDAGWAFRGAGDDGRMFDDGDPSAGNSGITMWGGGK
ncbi:MAG: hypothetical protein MPK62_00465 [Alphaproteobacteria bacterium]|nr:hypothetical protein [Alphaproteobacteria bacterium]MDA8029611.1 hypothetical protein [Alphaproteobacteria bacterium]